MRRVLVRNHIAILTIGIVISCFSGLISNEVLVSHYFWNTEGRDCTKEACLIAASGWPVGYILDQTWNSPVNSAGWMGIWLGIDDFDVAAFSKNALFWAFVIVVGRLLAKQLRPPLLD